MRGIIKSIVVKKNYGFIKAVNEGEYFFHKDDFTGHWIDLVADVEAKFDPIEVAFEIVKSSKGPRAANVRRLDHPNES